MRKPGREHRWRERRRERRRKKEKKRKGTGRGPDLNFVVSRINSSFVWAVVVHPMPKKERKGEKNIMPRWKMVPKKAKYYVQPQPVDAQVSIVIRYSCMQRCCGLLWSWRTGEAKKRPPKRLLEVVTTGTGQNNHLHKPTRPVLSAIGIGK
ncbi:hypothetical protein F5X96DRAFT_623887 [Biscogniauxia mediterranea]|nr:hypothetical protein F5X96DRAFT_623887 [Biscogniauxia mediterranea]